MEVNPFDILSNEVTSNIIGYLDARSLFRFCGCSAGLQEFKSLSNEHWRKLYSIQWLVGEQELCIYSNKDWMAEFKSRFIAENSYYEENARSEDASVTHLRKLLRSENSAEIIAELDALFSDYITGGSTEAQIISTAIAKLKPISELPGDKALNFVKLSIVSQELSSETFPIGIISLATEFLDLKYGINIILEAIKLVGKCCHREPACRDYHSWEDRLLDVIEKSVEHVALSAMSKVTTVKGDISSRPGLIQKIYLLLDQITDLGIKYADDMSTITTFIILLIENNINFLVDQGVLQKLIDILPKKLDCRLFYDIMRVISEFTYQETIAKKLAKDDVLLNFVLERAQNLRNNSTSEHDNLVVFDAIFCFFYSLIYCQGNVQHLWNSPYLEFVLLYLEADLGEGAYGNLCSVLSQFIRHGIETGRLPAIHKRFEPYIQTVIDSSYFKYSITVWQTYYCGMKLPTDIAKRLIERIIPELPFETNKKVMRAYAELLSNMVQVDNTPFLDIDMKQLYDYYSRQLVLDDRTNDPSSRAKIPFAINFIAAGASVPQFAELTIRNPELLEKMYSLYDCTKEANETIYMVVNFFSYVVKLPGWDNHKGLEILERWGTTMPLDAPMYYMFTMIDSFVHMFLRDNPVELLLFGTWIIARMSQRQDGRDGLKELSPDIIEWLSSHEDPRIRKHMNYYHQNLHRAQMGYVDENYVQRI